VKVLHSRRLIVLLGLLLWVAVMHWYWRMMLPLVPVEELRAEDGWASVSYRTLHTLAPSERTCLLDSGNLVLSRCVFGSEDDGEFRSSDSFGPIRVWDPIHHRVVHEITEFQGPIDEAWICRGGSAAVRSRDEILVFDLNSGRLVMRKIVEGDDCRAIFSSDERLVAIQMNDQQALIVYEAKTGRMVYEFPGANDPQGQVDFVGVDRLLLPTTIENERSFPHPFNTRTWRPEAVSRLDPWTWIRLASNDGRRAIIWGDDGYSLYDLIHLKTIVRLQELEEFRESQWEFREVGNEFIQIALPGPRRVGGSSGIITFDSENSVPLRVIRRDLDDGHVISDIRVQATRVFPMSRVSPDGRLFVGWHQTDVKLPSVFEWALTKMNIEASLEPRNTLDAIELSTGRLVTNVATIAPGEVDPELWMPTVDISDSGLAFDIDHQLRYYPYPLQRRWLWLIGWSLGPPAFLCLAAAGRRRWRLRREAARGSAAR